jgi:hypothetical protein
MEAEKFSLKVSVKELGLEDDLKSSYLCSQNNKIVSSNTNLNDSIE